MSDEIWRRIESDPPPDDGHLLLLLSGRRSFYCQRINIGFFADGDYWKDCDSCENPGRSVPLRRLVPVHWAPLPPYPTD